MNFQFKNKKCTFIEFKELDAADAKALGLLVRAFRSYLSALGNSAMLNRRESFFNSSSEHRAFIDLYLISKLHKWDEESLDLLLKRRNSDIPGVDLQYYVLLGHHLFPYLQFEGIILPLEFLELDRSFRPQSGTEKFVLRRNTEHEPQITRPAGRLKSFMVHIWSKAKENKTSLLTVSVITAYLTSAALPFVSYYYGGSSLTAAVSTAATIRSAALVGAVTSGFDHACEKIHELYTTHRPQSGAEAPMPQLSSEVEISANSAQQTNSELKTGYVPPVVQLNQSNGYANQATSTELFASLNAQVGGSANPCSMFKFVVNDPK